MAKKISFYGIFTALCMVLGYIEHLIPLSFIAPGIKLGLSNSVVLLLLIKKDVKGAFLINIARILLSVLLFAAPSTLIFSLSAGIVSTTVMVVLSRFKGIGVMGFSILGAVVHNLTQLICAVIILGIGVLYYLPFLLISALLSGALVGIIAKTLTEKIRF